MTNRCVLCLSEEESVNNLFVHWFIAYKIWGFLPLPSWYCLVLPWSVSIFDFGLGGLKTQMVSPISFGKHCLVSYVGVFWKARNVRIFESRVRNET